MPPSPSSEPVRRARAPYRKSDVVRRALVDATIELLSERPVATVSVRDIAGRAGVQHSLVSRHFGSKDALVAAAVAEVARDYADAVGASDDGAAGFVNAMEHLRDRPYSAFVLAAPASARSGDSVEERFPGYTAHLRGLRAAGAPDDLRTRVAVGMALGMVIAWNLVQDVLLDAAGVEPGEVDGARDLAESVLAGFVGQQVAPRA